ICALKGEHARHFWKTNIVTNHYAEAAFARGHRRRHRVAGLEFVSFLEPERVVKMDFAVTHGDIAERIKPDCRVKHPVRVGGGLINRRQNGNAVFTRGFAQRGDEMPVDGFSNFCQVLGSLTGGRKRHQKLWKANQLCAVLARLVDHRNRGAEIFLLVDRRFDLGDGDFAHEFPTTCGISDQFNMSKNSWLMMAAMTLTPVATSLHGTPTCGEKRGLRLKPRAVSQTQVIRAAVGLRSAWL